MIEANQPAGDHSSPPTNELMLVQPISPGINLKKRWGDAKFDGIAAVGSVWIVPPETPIDVDLRVPHAIRIVGIEAYAGAEALREEIEPSALERLSATPQTDRSIGAWMHSLSRAAQEDLDDPLFIADMFGALVERLRQLSLSPTTSFKGGLSLGHVKKVSELILAKSVEGVTISELAAVTSLSPFHFIRAFKTSLGVSPHQYIKLLRIHRAKNLLAHTRKSVLEIAVDVGYDSGQALSRAFRQEVGITPLAYREARQS